MKKTFRSILTMLLVVVMLFGVCAPTVAFAADTDTTGDTVKTSTGDTLDTGWCVVTYDEDELTVTLKPDVDAFLDVSKQQIKDLANQVIDGLKAIAFNQLKGDVEAGEGKDIPNEDLIDYVTAVYIDGVQVFGPFGENGDNVLKASAIKDILLDLPRPSEIKDMTNEEMKLSYVVSVCTTYGEYDFTLTGVVGGGYDKIRKIAEIVADHVDVSISSDGTYTLDVTVPEVFHKAVIKACETGLISDELKLKVFKALSKSVSEFEVYYNDFTFAELIELLEAIDFNGILSTDYVKKYVDLTHLSNDEIIAKVKEYEKYFNKAKTYAARLFELIPARFDDKTLMNLYDGNGEFSYVGTHTVDIEEELTKLSAKYGPIVASFIDKDTVTASVDIGVSFEKINRVQYVVNGKVVSEGFLPAGLEYKHVAFFAPVTEVDGKAVVAWVDEDGKAVTEMPDRDVVLNAVVDKDFTLIVSGDVDKPYDGDKSTVKVVGSSDTATYTYQWYKVNPEGDDIALGTSDSFYVVNVADSGEYYCVVTVTEGVITKTLTSDVVTVNITKKVIPATDVKWSTPTEFEYDGTEKSVYAYGIDNVEFVYENDKKTDADNYVAKIVGVNLLDGFDSDNCELDSAIVGLTQAWSITPIVIKASDLAWDVPEGFDGNVLYDPSAEAWKPVLVSVPDGAVVNYTYVTGTDVGVDYSASVTVTAKNGNYKVEGSVADLEWVLYTDIIEVNVSELLWDVPENFSGSLVYDPTATEWKPVLVSVPEGVEASYEYVTGTDVGEYGATVTFTAKDGYKVIGEVAPLAWTITVASVDLSQFGWTELEKVYNGSEQKPTLVVPDEYASLVTAVVEGRTDADTYKTSATVTLVDDKNYALNGTLPELDWTIEKKVIDLSEVDWAEVELVYNGNAQYVELVLPDDAPDCLMVIYEYYIGEEKIDAPVNAGSYIARVVNIALDELNPDYKNYSLVEPDSIDAYEFDIAKADYVLTDVTLPNKVVSFDGELHSIEIVGTLPDFITVEYSAKDFYYIGTYTVVATFTVSDPNYNNNIPAMEATLEITFVAKNEHVYKDGDGNIIVKVTGTKIPADNEFKVNDNSHLYTNVTLPDGENGVVIVAYDIYFAKDGTHQPINDDFGVSIRIPAAYQSGKTLRIVYITEDGEIEQIDSTVDGEYVNFDTEHFSTYAIVSVEAAPTPAPEPDLTWLWIILALIIIALLIVIILLLVRRRKNDDGEPTEPVDTTPVVEPEGEPEEEEAVTEEPVEEPATEPVTEPVVEEPAEEPAPAEEPTEPEDVFVEPEEEPICDPDAIEVSDDDLIVPTEEELADEPATEPVVEEPAPEPAPAPVVVPLGEEDEDGVRSAIVDGEVVYVRYRSSFESRLIQSDNEIQDYYTVIKNTLLSYKGVKSRTSWNFESFNKGRVQCAKLNVKGRALLVYLGLDPKDYNASKYHFTDASDKPKFEKVPMLLKVKSDRSLKYVLELIEEMMKTLDIPQVDMPGVDYHMPYESTDALAKRGLVKVILPAGMKLDENSNIVKVDVGELLDGYEAKEKPAPVEEPVAEPVVEEPVAEPVAEPAVEEPVTEPVVEEPVHVDAVTADEMLTDEEAEAKIEVVHTGVKRSGKLVEINLDVICENYEDGEVVDLDSLKAKKLVNKNAGRIKVLARGTMTKSLTILASKFSLQAVKMITLAGGVAEIED